MSDEADASIETQIEIINARKTALLAEEMNRLRGRLLGMVEAVGFPPTQEKGIKQLLKSLTYDAQADLAEAIETSPFPYGECNCGCGESTKPYQSSRLAKNQIKGQPQKFVKGHYRHPQLAFDIDEDTGCWNWRGTKDLNGYGRLSTHKEQFLAHRYFYTLNVGEIGEGMDLHHTCHNRSCVNPQHLEQITRSEHGGVTQNRYADIVREQVAEAAREAIVAWHEDNPERMLEILTSLSALNPKKSREPLR